VFDYSRTPFSANGRITVVPSRADAHRGMMAIGALLAPCALGRGGVNRIKREGDGRTPAGRFHLLSVWYRPDRWTRPVSALPTLALTPDMGWCDDPGDRRYNRPVRLPLTASHERLWRDDHLYDVMIVLDHNTSPVRTHAGSAIFLHLAAPDFRPTEGCVAVTAPFMRRLLARARPGAYVDIGWACAPVGR